jgi:hypothetical protein
MGTSRLVIETKSTVKKSVKFKDTMPVSQTISYHYEKMNELNAVFLK